MGTEVGFRSQMRIWGQMPKTPAGIVSPQHLSGDDAQAGNWCSVRGLSGHSGCLKDRKDELEGLEGSPMWVQCLWLSTQTEHGP